MVDDGGARSLELLRQRIASIPDALSQALNDDAPRRVRSAFPPHPERLTIVGAGGSAGPARILGACLTEAGWTTEIAPPSRFVLDSAPRSTPLAVISQGMSPNARLALCRSTGPTLLLTAADVAPAPHVTVLRHGPEQEPHMLVRVVGPVLATLAAIRFSGIVDESQLRALPERVAAARCTVPDHPVENIVIITAGQDPELAHGLRWKLLETLGLGDPPIYDVLQFAHGPFQQLVHQPVCFVVLDHGHPAEHALYERLGEMVIPERHTVLRLRATLPAPLAWFEHDAQINQLVIALLERAPRDLIDWPGRGHDAGLYGLDA